MTAAVTLAAMGNGPAFSATASAVILCTSGVATKIPFNSKQWDTNVCYDAITNFRFTPTTAGYYQVNITAQLQSTNATNSIAPALFKNGAAYSYGSSPSATSVHYPYGNVSILCYLNGSTDYIEAYVVSVGATSNIQGNQFQAFLARAA